MAFDATSFLDMSTEDTMDTRRIPIPPDDYTAMIKKVEAFEVKDKPDVIRLSITYDLSAPELEESIGIAEPQCRQTIFVELDDNGGFDTGAGKNTKLGALREAVGLNEGEFNLGMLAGRGPILVHVSHRSPEGEPDIVYDEIKRVTALAA